MLKELLIKIEFYEETVLGIFVSIVLLVFAVSLKIENVSMVFLALWAIGLTYFSLNKYVKERELWRRSIRYKDFNECSKLATKECQVGQINKFLSKEDDKGKVFYDVYFKYPITKDGKKTYEVGCIKVGLDDDPEILLSLDFTFVESPNGIQVKSLDKNNFKRTHTQVMVYCFNGAVLHEKSINGYDFIYRGVKNEDQLYKK